MNVILVVNSGSSSLKYEFLNVESEQSLAKGIVERVGASHGTLTHTVADQTHERAVQAHDHTTAFQAMIDACRAWGPDLTTLTIAAIGHRVVQGGARFITPTVIDEAVIRAIDELSALAPLHNPPNLLGIEAARRSFPDVIQVAVFDTAFHHTMPESAFTYAIDTNLARQYQIRRYGFHGTSHKYVAVAAAEFLGIAPAAFNGITLHIGNGVSLCAIQNGRSVDTSMGMTPLEGLVMGTRSGNIDPGILFHLHRQAGMSIDQLDDLLNRHSGMKGLTGGSDLRDIEEAIHRGDPRAQLALEIYCRRLRQYIGAYLTEIDPVHALVFTAGVGENSALVRKMTLTGLERFGIVIDQERNAARNKDARKISTGDSPIPVLVIPTNEELEIARQTGLAMAAIPPDTHRL